MKKPRESGAFFCIAATGMVRLGSADSGRHPSPTLPFAMQKGGGVYGDLIDHAQLLPPFAAGKGRAGEGGRLNWSRLPRRDSIPA
ncbi:hypothetical protein D3C81_583320 [compost metagenome]